MDPLGLIRPLAAAALLGAVLAGSFITGAINAAAKKTWPDF